MITIGCKTINEMKSKKEELIETFGELMVHVESYTGEDVVTGNPIHNTELYDVDGNLINSFSIVLQ